MPAAPQGRQPAQEEYWAAESAYTVAQRALESAESETCKQFGLSQWWDPDDLSITIKNAPALVGPSSSVEVLDPPHGKRMGWHTQADKDGWLTLKVNLKAPLEQSEEWIARLLRLHRSTLSLPNTRNRPDSDAKALEAWVCYDGHRNFTTVATQLERPVSTVKGQYVRAHMLIHGQPPTGSIKQRRVGIVKDPAGEFQAHLGSCSRCLKADTPDKFCPRWAAYVTQDTKALRERPRSPLASPFFISSLLI